MSEAATNDSTLELPQVARKISVSKKTVKNKVQPSFFEKSLLVFMFVAVFLGWMIKEEEVLTAESGWGYALGIIGGSLMLILMLYPMRKHAKFMKNWGPVRYWFRAHMFLGVIGPAAVLYHSNFSLGSINSNVALFSMLTVACSGLVGRFIYSKIHLGLYGRKSSLEELQAEIKNSKKDIDNLFSNRTSNVIQPLVRFEEKFVNIANYPLLGIFLLPILPLHSKFVHFSFQRRVNKTINKRLSENALTKMQAKKAQKIFSSYAKKYVSSTAKVVEFVVYERVFSLWHMLHLPLFIIMLSTGIFHVYAVHMY